MDFATIFLILCIVSSARSFSLDSSCYRTFTVLDYGAIGNGRVDDSQAFLKAWRAVCGAATKTSILFIPSRMTFLLKCLEFKGPCNAGEVHVRVLGTIVAPKDAPAYNSNDKWLSFEDVNRLTIDGSGQIDGQGSAWWTGPCRLDEDPLAKNCHRPTALSFHNCKNLRLSGLKHVNSQRNHISINQCNGVDVSHINITAPEESPNTDGIDISASSYIQIHDSYIGTGDDCVAINDGSSYINITNVACGPGHGISVGSLGAGGAHATVEEVHVQNCNFSGTQNGVRIKTWQGGSGYARKISFNQITLTEVRNPIIIDQYYCNGEHDCSNHTTAVKVSDVTYAGVHGSTVSEAAINLSCSQSVGCTNIVLDGINIISADRGEKTYSYCSNVQGTSIDTNPPVHCLS